MTTAGSVRRAALAGAVIALHFGVYRFVNELNARRPPSAFLDLSTTVDGLVPYLGWTWPVYYAALPYVMVAGVLAILRLPPGPSVRAVKAYVAMIAIGGSLQLLLPARSPWPVEPIAVQRFVHESLSYDPFVCLPSMHVALVTLTACLAASVWPGAVSAWGHGSAAILVSLSTLTLKEHWTLDVAAGGLLAAAAFTAWRHAAPEERRAP